MAAWDGAGMAELSIEKTKTIQYSRKLQSALQQTASRLRGLVTVHTGIRDKLFEIPKIGKRSLSKSTGGKTDTPDNANTFSKRWMAPEWWEDGYLHDRQINLETQFGDQIVTKTQEAQLAACERTIDERIIEACLGDALDGENGTGKVVLPASQKIAMNAVHDELAKEGLSARLILQVHDELIVETPVEEQEKVTALLRRCMEGAANLRVPLIADVQAGHSWYDTK